MPEAEGYLGILKLLDDAMNHMPEGHARDLVQQAYRVTIDQARQSISSLEMGIDLGRLLGDAP